MNSREFGKLIAALRKQNLNEYGLQWTREDLSRYIHLSSHQLGRLERGDRKYLDRETLQLLAKAFNLTTLERKELFFAAVGMDEDELFDPEHSRAQVTFNDLVSKLRDIRLPAFVLDDYADIVAANTMAIGFYRVDPEYMARAVESPAGFNMLKFIYAPDSGFSQVLGTAWENMAVMNIQYFRRISLRRRHKPYFIKILAELRRIKEFDLHWHVASRSVSHVDWVYDTIRWDHPDFGPLYIILTESAVPTRHGNLYLFTYLPGDENTVGAFLALAAESGESARLLAPWPDKPLE